MRDETFCSLHQRFLSIHLLLHAQVRYGKGSLPMGFARPSQHCSFFFIELTNCRVQDAFVPLPVGPLLSVVHLVHSRKAIVSSGGGCGFCLVFAYSDHPSLLFFPHPAHVFSVLLCDMVVCAPQENFRTLRLLPGAINWQGPLLISFFLVGVLSYKDTLHFPLFFFLFPQINRQPTNHSQPTNLSSPFFHIQPKKNPTMVTTSNKTVVYRKHPSEYPIAGEHLDVESRELVTDLKENEVLTRNLFLSIDPCM